MNDTAGNRHIGREIRDGIARVVLDHPPVNVLTGDVLAELRTALTDLAETPDLRVVLLLAEGKHFSAGADVAEHLPPTYETLIPAFLNTVRMLDEFPLPVIAGVQGRCLGGGCELILATDLVVAGERARIGQPEIALGVVPPAACALLPERTTRGWAAELIFTGEPLTAAQARDAGLVHVVVPDDEVVTATAALAARIACHSAAALRVAKRSLRLGRPRPTDALARAGWTYVRDLMDTADATEGLRAFLEKRPPSWAHR